MKTINAAVFKVYSRFSDSGMATIKEDMIDNYEWESGETQYRFKARYIGKWGTILWLKPKRFDVIIMPGANTYWAIRKGSPIFSPTWRKAVKKYVREGGGYVGICGGATIACRGRKTSDTSPGSIAEFLGISNTWANQVLWRQDQYDIRNPETGGIPLDIKIKESGNPVFDPFYFQHTSSERSMRYWGGPALIKAGQNPSLTEEVVSVGEFADEPMEKAPLHWFGTGLKVKTDMKEKMAIVATTYGNGKIMLFGTHPEVATWHNGHIEEYFISYPKYKWMGKETQRDYNWWMLRRAVAWASQKVPDEHLPPAFSE